MQNNLKGRADWYKLCGQVVPYQHCNRKRKERHELRANWHYLYVCAAVESSNKGQMDAVAQQRRSRAIRCSVLTSFSLCALASAISVAYHFLDGGRGRDLVAIMSNSSSILGRVLCYGDSLTAGYHSFGRGFNPYGRKLQELLGPQYKVS